MGHNFGVSHSNALDCIGSLVSKESFSYECNSREYGDPFDLMGFNIYNDRQGSFNAPHRLEIGWLPQENTKEVEEGTFFLRPINSPYPLGNIQQLQLPVEYGGGIEKGYYSIDFKEITDYDVGGGGFLSLDPNSIFVRLASRPEEGRFTFEQTNLILGKDDDFTFGSGKSFIDEINGYKITLLNVSSLGAEVKVERIQVKSPDLEKPLVHFAFEPNRIPEGYRCLSRECQDGFYPIHESTGLISGGYSLKDPFSNKDVPSGEMYFDGENYIKFPSTQLNSLIDKNNAFTFSLFAKKDLENSFMEILDISGGFIYLYLRNNWISLSSSGFGSPVFLSAKIPSDNRWHHMVGVSDGNHLDLYVDGKIKDSSPLDPFKGSLTLHKPSFIGGSEDFNGFFKGSLDEVKIWARALSGEEIKNLYDDFFKDLPTEESMPVANESEDLSSKIANKGNSDIEGRLVLVLDEKIFDERRLFKWVYSDKFILPAWTSYDLSSLWNPQNVSVDSLGLRSQGEFRVYAGLWDDSGNVMIDSRGKEIEAVSDIFVVSL